MLQKVLEVKVGPSVAVLKHPQLCKEIQLLQASSGPSNSFSHCDHSFTPSLCRHKGKWGVLSGLWGAGGVDTIHSSAPLPLLVQDRPIFRRPVVWILKIKLQVRKRDCLGGGVNSEYGSYSPWCLYEGVSDVGEESWAPEIWGLSYFEVFKSVGTKNTVDV